MHAGNLSVSAMLVRMMQVGYYIGQNLSCGCTKANLNAHIG